MVDNIDDCINKLKEFREKHLVNGKRMTQVRLSELLHLSCREIQYIEAGTIKISKRVEQQLKDLENRINTCWRR